MPEGYSLKDFTSWKTGGTCSLLIAPHTVGEALDFLKCCKQSSHECFILGGGTNVLAADGFTEAAVLYTGHIKNIYSLAVNDNSVEIEVECGCSTKQLMAYALRHSISGTEFLTGIPGTIGGALYGNAGGRSEVGFNAIVKEITTITADCTLKKYAQETINWQYRSCPVGANDLMIASCKMLLTKADGKEIRDNIRKFADLKKGQPIGKATAGCVFKNPKGLSAGKLIDEAGCRGMRIGDAVVSMSHANFIENAGNATAREIYALCEMCRKKVLTKYGVKLEYEIKILGNVEKSRETD